MRFFQADSNKVSGMATGSVSLSQSHDIVKLSFCNLVKGQANNQNHISMKKIMLLFALILYTKKNSGQKIGARNNYMNLLSVYILLIHKTVQF